MKAHCTYARYCAGYHGGANTDHRGTWRVPYESSAGGSASNDSTLTLHDFIYATYNSLLANGWHMNDIDEMDFLGFLHLRAWEAKKEKKQKEPRMAYIDQVWPSKG